MVPSTRKQHAGHTALIVGFVFVGTIALFVAMRAVAPIRERRQRVDVPVATSSTTALGAQGVPIVPPVAQEPARPSIAVGEPNPMRARPEGAACDARNVICVNIPESGALVDNPTVVTGTAVTFENRVSWRLEDGEDNLIAGDDASTDASEAGQPGAFSLRVFWGALPRTAQGVLSVYELSAKDNTVQNIVRVPVRFLKKSNMNRSLYFLPEAAAQTDCTAVQASSVTIPSSAFPVEATLRALLDVDSSATPAGLVTQVPDRTKLVSLVVSNGTATAIFDSGLERDGGGSCRVSAIRAQIEQTLRQFSSVKNVVISVQGKNADETLQP